MEPKLTTGCSVRQGSPTPFTNGMESVQTQRLEYEQVLELSGNKTDQNDELIYKE